MKKLKVAIVVVGLLTILLWKPIFFPDQALHETVAYSSNSKLSNLKVDILLWRGANPLWENKGDDSSIEAAIYFKNYNLIRKMSDYISDQEKHELVQKHELLIESGDNRKILEAMNYDEGN